MIITPHLSSRFLKPDLADDGLPPLEPLCEFQAHIATNYASVLALTSQLHADAPDEAEAKSLEFLINRLHKDALWAVTEVSRSNEFKIRRQRYISQGVYDRWSELIKKATRQKGLFDKDANGHTLIHEHVVQRKGVEHELKNLRDADAAKISDHLQRLFACVVTRVEHRLLEPHKKYDGWERYRRAQLGVYDRLQKCWIVKRSH